MANGVWPLFDLEVRTPRLELRYPTDELLFDLAEVAARGVHDPSFMPFLHPWTRSASPELERSTLRHWWSLRASWSPTHWHLPLAVLVDGAAIGVQSLMSKDFAVTRTVSSGSWIGLEHQGRGTGSEMRAAALHLAFAGLGALNAYSGAFEDNTASLRLSQRLGYEPNGDRVVNREGAPARVVELKLTRETWEQTRRTDIRVSGLDSCREWFGVELQ
jgi:RimJ/RimL family protein N-acetyltransferase